MLLVVSVLSTDRHHKAHHKLESVKVLAHGVKSLGSADHKKSLKNRLSKKKKDCESDLKGIDTSLTELDTKVGTVKTSFSSFKTDYSAKFTQVSAKLDTMKTSLTTKITDLEASLKESMSKEIGDLDKTVQANKASIKELCKKVDKLTADTINIMPNAKFMGCFNAAGKIQDKESFTCDTAIIPETDLAKQYVNDPLRYDSTSTSGW